VSRDSGDLGSGQIAAEPQRKHLLLAIAQPRDRVQQIGIGSFANGLLCPDRRFDRLVVQRIGSAHRAVAVVVDQQVSRDRHHPGRRGGAARVVSPPGSPRPLECQLGEVLSVAARADPVGKEAVDAPDLLVVDLGEVWAITAGHRAGGRIVGRRVERVIAVSDPEATGSRVYESYTGYGRQLMGVGQRRASSDLVAKARPRRDEYLVFGAPLIEDEDIAEVVDSMRSGWVGTGPKVERFERALEDYLGVEHVRCVASCTAGLILGMKILGIGPGDEVLVPSMTFVASANAVEHTGAVPVFVDSEPGTGLIDRADAEAKLTERTKAMMPVHLAGRPVDLDWVTEFRRRHGLLVVEDAAHALGAQWRGRSIGTHGNLTAYSFYVTKNITSIEGGAIATNDAAVAAEVERLALHGLSLGAWQRFSDQGFRHYEVVKPGWKFNMTDVQAALGLRQLGRLDEWIDRRDEQWHRYDEMLSRLPLELPPPAPEGIRHARHLYQVLVGPEAPLTRDELLTALHVRRIGSGVHYRGVHLHPYYQSTYEIAPGDLPVAHDISTRTLSLPLGPALTDADQDDVVAALEDALSG